MFHQFPPLDHDPERDRHKHKESEPKGCERCSVKNWEIHLWFVWGFILFIIFIAFAAGTVKPTPPTCGEMVQNASGSGSHPANAADDCVKPAHAPSPRP